LGGPEGRLSPYPLKAPILPTIWTDYDLEWRLKLLSRKRKINPPDTGKNSRMNHSRSRMKAFSHGILTIEIILRFVGSFSRAMFIQVTFRLCSVTRTALRFFTTDKKLVQHQLHSEKTWKSLDRIDDGKEKDHFTVEMDFQQKSVIRS